MSSTAAQSQALDRYGRARLTLAALALVIGAVAPAGGLSQGPNSPSSVVNEGTFPPDDPWGGLEETKISDDVYGGYSPPADVGTTQYLKATGFGFSIPSGAVINGIEVAIEGHANVLPGGEFHAVAARIVKGGTIGATDGSAGGEVPGTPDSVFTIGGSSDLWGDTWTAADINAGDFGFAYKVFSISTIVLIDAISMTVFYTPPACSTPLDCDDGNPCTSDSCDPMSGCVHDDSLVGGCRTALKSILILKDKSPDSKDKLVWKWVKGQSTTQEEFGVPTGTTQYALCVHAGTTAALLAHYTVPGDAMKWAPIGTNGYKYTDPTASASGITKVLLKGSAQDKSKCLVKGKGTNLDDFDLTDLVDPVTVQLVNSANSTCFQSTFGAADFIKFNDPAQFKAKAQ